MALQLTCVTEFAKLLESSDILLDRSVLALLLYSSTSLSSEYLKIFSDGKLLGFSV